MQRIIYGLRNRLIIPVREFYRGLKHKRKRARDSKTFHPNELFNQQFVRYVYYRHLSEWLPFRFPTNGERKIRVVEFGGSNGVIVSYFKNAEIEIAPNYPEVDIQNLTNYANDTYDCVILDQIIEHVPRPWDAIREVRRVLKKGGVCICATPFMVRIHNYPKDYWRFAEDGLHELFSDYSAIDISGWGNRFALFVTARDYWWADSGTTKGRQEVDLSNEPDWPIVYLTKATK
jgi:SAM-dependent methyltransferase